ncbi:MAG: response regulator [Rikenellaceae bacterium]
MVKSLDIESGLLDNGVTSIYRDSRGYIWIGTYDGLMRYSNSVLTTYTNSLENKIFRSNRIRSICEDIHGNMWIGTDRGVTLYQYEQRKFVNLDYNKNQDPLKGCIVRQIFNSQDGRYVYCLTERDGVLVYNSEAELIRQVTLDSRLYFQSVIHISDENYLFGSNQGLILYDFVNGNIERVYKQDNYTVATPASLVRESDSTLLYGTIRGVHRLKILNRRDDVIEFEFCGVPYYSNRAIKSMYRSAEGRIFIGAVSTGVYFVDKLGDKLNPIIEQRRTSALLSLPSGELWVGTFDDGAILFDQEQSNFKAFDTSYFERSIFRTTQICPFDDENILYRHNFYELSLFNIKSGDVVPLPFELNDAEHSFLKYIHVREDGDLWFLYQSPTNSWWRWLKRGERKAVRIEAPLLSQHKLGNVTAIVYDDYGSVWIAAGELLIRTKMDENHLTQSVERVNNHPIFNQYINQFRYLYIDPKYPDRLYVATTATGLYVIDLSANTSAQELSIDHYSESDSSISSNFISAFIRTFDGTLWIGTEQGGVCRVDESGERLEFSPYSQTQGLSNNSVKSMLCDKSGKLWVATNNGLNCYDQVRDCFNSYSTEQGVPFSTFDYPSFVCRDMLFFSGAKNTCYFNPSELPVVQETPLIIFDMLKLYDQEVLPGTEYSGRVILDSTLKSGDVIILNHDEKHFTIDVDVMSSSTRHNHLVQYRLLPISKQWSQIEEMSDNLSFRGLQSGKYELQVRAANSLGEYGEVERLYIRVKRPVWLRWWAISLYIILLVVTLVVINISLMRMQRLRYQLHIEALSKHNLEQLNAEKMRYFSNMSHEIKTPLTLIMAPLSLLSSRFSIDADVSRKLLLIKRQAQKIFELVELMHGVQLNDSNLLKRADSEFVMQDMLREIYTDFEHVTQLDNKILTLECDTPDFMVRADRSMVEKIIDNLLSNAIKHTASADKITIRCSSDGDIMKLEVEDTGYGIAPGDIEHIFERFFRAKDRQGSKASGTGIGLYFSKILAELHSGSINVSSQLGHGSIFTVELPIIVDRDLPIEVADDNISEPKEPEGELVIGSIEPAELENEELDEAIKESLVFVVEDNAEMRTLITDFLSNKLNVRGFSNGAEALAALDEQWPDLIISDVMMPQMDGYELCQRVKSNIKTSHIPVILLTACSTVDDKIKGLNSGADAYISKPFYPKYLLTRVVTLLNNRQRLRERFEVGIPLNYGKNSNTSAKDNEFMAQLYELFNKYLADEEISLNDIAMELGQNRSMFFKKVKVITNTSPFELLKEYRLKRAAELLQDGEHNVNEVCMMTGFKDRSHFSRLFKEKYNMSPSKWREQMQPTDVENEKINYNY